MATTSSSDARAHSSLRAIAAALGLAAFLVGVLAMWRGLPYLTHGHGMSLLVVGAVVYGVASEGDKSA